MLWTWRNKALFDDSFSFPSNLSKVILDRATKIYVKAVTGLIYDIKKGEVNLNPRQWSIFLRWIPPKPNWVKLNIDVCTKGQPRLVGVGGLIQDGDGGFLFYIGICHNDSAECWTLLQLAWSRGFRRVQVGSDSATTVDMVNKVVPELHPLAL